MIDLRLHAPTLVGTAALLLAALLGLALVPRWQAEQAHADRTLQQRARQAAPPALPQAVPPADQRLVAALPPAGAAPQRVAALVEMARHHGLRLDSVRQLPPLRLGTGQATLPAERVPLRLTGSGPYSAWRRFVAQALQADDALLLAQLQLSRSGPAVVVLVADLHWVLLQRVADGDGPGRGAVQQTLAAARPVSAAVAAAVAVAP